MFSKNRNPSFESSQPSNGNRLPYALVSVIKSATAELISIGPDALGVADVLQNYLIYLKKEDTNSLQAIAYQVRVRELGSALSGKYSRIALNVPESMLDQGC